MTIFDLLHIMPRAKDVVDAWIGPLEQAIVAYEIITPDRMAMFLANIAHESLELTALEENLHYKPAGLRKIFPRHFPDDAIAQRYANLGPEAIANKVYASRLGNGPESSGDGWKFRGRSPIGLTFHANYSACSAAILGDSQILIDHPEFIADTEFGAAAAGWYWDLHKCNELADAGDFDGVCDAINLGRKTVAVGDSNGYESRAKYFERAQEALK